MSGPSARGKRTVRIVRSTRSLRALLSGSIRRHESDDGVQAATVGAGVEAGRAAGEGREPLESLQG